MTKKIIKTDQEATPDIQKIIAQTKSFEELADIIASYFVYGRKSVDGMLNLMSIEDIRPLAKAFRNTIEKEEYATFKGNIILAKQYDDESLMLALSLLLNLYEMDKCMFRAYNSATCSFVKMFKEV